MSQLSQIYLLIDIFDSFWYPHQSKLTGNKAMNYPGIESSTLEFKRIQPSNRQVLKAIVAFCNHFGGKLIIGVEDDGQVCGVDEQGVDDAIESLNRCIYQSCTPCILPSIYTQRFGEKLVLAIEVTSGMSKPYFITSLGLTEGVFIRAGANSMQANPAIINELSWKSRGYAPDEIPQYSANIDDLDQTAFTNFLKTHRSKFLNGTFEEQLAQYKLMVSEHRRNYPTLAALILFGREPARFLPEAFVICSHFKGLSGRDALDTKDCTGNLFEQVDSAMNWIKSRLSLSFKIEGLQREEKLEIPEVAIREVLVNAIVHRDYNILGPIKIAIYDNRVEIFSPGTFPGPIDTEHLEMGITYIRNHVISRIFRETGYVEKLGSGFLTLFESYRSENLEEPSVIEGKSFVKCVLPRYEKESSESSGPSEKIKRLFLNNPKLMVGQVIEELAVSRQTASRYLAEMVKNGSIKRIGSGPAVRYVLANP